MKVNVDAALFAKSKRMRFGLVIRDHNGDFLAASEQACNRTTDPELAKAIDLRHAVRFVSNIHITR